jgi:hypothetical protein
MSFLSSLFGTGGGSSVPSFNPQQDLAFQQQEFNQMSPQALGFGSNAFNQAAQQGISFAQQGTQANIANQEAVTPGSQAQRELAQNQLNSYIQGQVPLDVQQNIQRQVAGSLGGGFNLFSGGGQAPQNFARNIGQTSVGLSQYGLSAAPTWQQLSNSMVVNPSVGLSAGLQSIGQGIGLATSSAQLGNQLAESQYQSQMNQYLANQQANQAALNLLLGSGSAGTSLGSGTSSAGSYSGLASLLGSGSSSSSASGSGFLNTLFGSGGSGISSLLSSSGAGAGSASQAADAGSLIAELAPDLLS